eukprot:ANDGO_03526.mRNA.1 hypothetical protein PPTG_03977
MSYRSRLTTLVFLIVVDIIFGTLNDTPADPVFFNLFYLFVQILVIIGMAVNIYLFMSHTLYFQAGLFSPLFKHFKWSFIVIFLYFILNLALRVIRILDNLIDGNNIYAIYGRYTWYAWLWGILKYVAIASYVLSLDAAAKLSDPKYYVTNSSFKNSMV